MKKVLQVLVVVLCMGITTSVCAQSQNSLIGQARGAAHDCLHQYEGDYNINATVNVQGTCPDGSNSYTVTFTAGPKCPGNGPCPFFQILVATVDFDCNGDLKGVNCFGN